MKNREGGVFCVHGGLSRGLETLQSILEVDRFKEFTDDDAALGLLWNTLDRFLSATFFSALI